MWCTVTVLVQSGCQDLYVCKIERHLLIIAQISRLFILYVFKPLKHNSLHLGGGGGGILL